METSGLWSKQKAADFLFSDVVPDSKKRLEKLNNRITRKRIPLKCMDKIGREILFFGDVLKDWVNQRKQERQAA